MGYPNSGCDLDDSRDMEAPFPRVCAAAAACAGLQMTLVWTFITVKRTSAHAHPHLAYPACSAPRRPGGLSRSGCQEYASALQARFELELTEKPEKD